MITTVAFDYGRVLAYPVTGNWFITRKTPEILGVDVFKSVMSNEEAAYSAMKKAYKAFEKHLLYTESEEIDQFTQFFSLFLSYMGIEISFQVCKELATDIVCNDDKVSFYDDVYEGLRTIKKKYKIVIISDTYPSLRRILNNKGIINLLDGLFMSCEYNKTKGTTEIFQIALAELREVPNNVVFIDDSVNNLQNAEKSGLFPILMDRNNTHTNSKYPIAKNMSDVQNIIGNYCNK